MTFNLTIIITARDVTDAGIGVGRVGLNVAQQVSEAPVKVNEMNLSTLFGQPLTIANLVALRIAIRVEAMDYTAERAIISFDDSLGKWQTTNPHLTPTGSKTDLAIDARLGVMRFAPLRMLPETTPEKPDFNPSASLIEPHGNTFAYRGLWLEDTLIARLSDPIPGDPAAEDWKRFAHEKKHWIAREHGTFALLEFGFPAPNTNGRPRLLVGVWYPNHPFSDTADVNVFYSPNTGPPYPGDTYPFTKAYPYQMSPKEGHKGPNYTLTDLDLPYLGLAMNYVCVGYKLVYQMLAAGKNSIIVMPLQPASQWGPLVTRTCLWRLVLETVRFGEAQRLISRTGKVGRLDLVREGASVSTDGVGQPGAPYARTQIRVTTSAFSAGLGAMLSLISTSKLKDDTPYPPSHFAAADGECQSAWKAIWDVDGGFHQLGGFEACMRPMLAWRKEGAKRVLRMYHSEDTVNANTSVLDLAPDIAVKRHTGKVGFIDQGYTSDRLTLWVLFSNPTLRKKSPSDDTAGVWPSFGSQDAHHMVPTVAFGHAWLIS
jgi:hypothetical protein